MEHDDSATPDAPAPHDAPSSTVTTPAPDPMAEVRRRSAEDEKVPLGARIAGAVLIANVAASVIELFMPSLREANSGPLDSPIHVIVDLAVGIALLRGVAKWQKVAVVRVLLGVLLFGGVAASKSDWFLLGAQVAFSAGLLGLLVGAPGRARIGASLAAVSLLFGLECIGLYATATGSNPLSGMVLSMKGDIKGQPVDHVDGARATWHLTVPPGHWYLRDAAAAAKDNALADRWLIDPAHDAHIIVIAEPLDPGAVLPVDAYMKAVLDNARSAATKFRVVEEPAELQSAMGPARIAHSASTINNVSVESYHAVFVGPGVGYQVMAFSIAESFSKVGPELKQIVATFKP